tara:strand:+ start:2242 stop:3120 length:879 start_codon:yes stop_codon:yes gene_type:complete
MNDNELDKEHPDFDKIRHFKADWKDFVDFWEKKGARMTPFAEWEQEYPEKKKMKSNPVHLYKTFDDESKVQESKSVEQSAGFAIVYNGKVLLAHSAGKPRYTAYGIPKGHLDGDETVLQAALRETQEEVGITIPTKLIPSSYRTCPYMHKKKGHWKDVHYFTIVIESLGEIGLKDEVVPKSQLQAAEVDWAGFIPLKKARKVTSSVMKPIIDSLMVYESNEFMTFEQHTKDLNEDNMVALAGSQEERIPMPKPFVLSTKKKRKGSNEDDEDDETQEVANMNATGPGSGVGSH